MEGLITAAVLCFVYDARPELLWGVEKSNNAKRKLSFKTTIIILAAASVIIGGGLSLIASSYPDGLEWSMEKVAGTAELEADGIIYNTMAEIQDKTAILPDYWYKSIHL